MKSKYKRIIIVLSDALVILIGANIYTYASSGKNVFEFFFEDSEKDMSYLMEKYGQSVTIDEYTIILDSAIFDDKAETIYSMFRVSKKKGKVETSMDKYDTLLQSSFGEDNRFSLWVNADTGAGGAMTGEYDGDDLLIYASYTYHCDETEDTNAIYLYDGQTGQTRFENYAAKFELKPTTNAIEISINDTMKMYISPVAIRIVSSGQINTDTVEICYKDGTTEEVVNVEEGKGTGSSSASQTVSGYTETYVSFELIDIEQIESVIYNGEKISK